MDPTKWLDTVEDFILVNDVPSARQAASARLLMTEAVRRELSPPGSARDISWQELRRRRLDTYDNSNSPVWLEICFSGLRQQKDQSVRDFASEVAEVAEGSQRRGNGELRLSQGCGQFGPDVALGEDGDGARSALPRAIDAEADGKPPEAPSGSATGEECTYAARGRCRCRWEAGGDASTSLLWKAWSILGTNFLDQYVKLIDWQDGEMTMTDGSKVRIVHKPAQATRPGIEYAWTTASPRGVPGEATEGERPENDGGELGTCERVLLDGAECSAQIKRVLGSLLRRLVQHRIETEGAQQLKLPPRRLPQAQRETVDRLIREMLQPQAPGAHRCAGGGQVVQRSGLGVRLLASRGRRRRPGENSVLHTSGAVSIPRHAVRAVQRPGDVSAIDKKSAEGADVENVPRLPRRGYRLREDKGGAPRTLGRGVVTSAVRGTEDQAREVPTNAAECTLPGPCRNVVRGWYHVTGWLATPRCVTEVRQFLELASYYGRFVRNFAGVANPLHALTKKGEKWHREPNEEEAFTRLKEALVSPPFLGHPDFDLTFLLEVDASGDAVGAVLSQQGEQNTPAMIAYASRSLSRAERGYCATRREMLALVWATQQLRPYPYGRRLAGFDFEVVPRAGRKHQNVDALSRRVCKQCGLEGSPAKVPVGAVQLDAANPIKQWQECDKELQQIREWSTQKSGDHMPEVGDPGYGRGTAAAGHPEIEDPGDPGRRSQPAIGGPFGRGKDAGKVTPSILLAPAMGRRRGLVPGVPDVRGTSGPDKEAPGTQATPAVMCEYCSKWPEAFALPNAEARTVAEALVNGLFCLYGAPETLHFDQELRVRTCKGSVPAVRGGQNSGHSLSPVVRWSGGANELHPTGPPGEGIH
ncbi:Retrovirus-related Pol polyprotein from transposon [Trichinella pseudospiralis]|uniref:RNA-directed DNA polymerase n=1 Tax=Trichinella pseudospiralis TaxID=6337 RepID=A0A0V1FPQ8_TRIPS|nr:Retrovirus-related Pol polyprotein from transposon [Trichinella pseudospiralis]